MKDRLLDACAFFASETYTTQMRALARGSDGLAEIHTSDLSLVLVPLIDDKEQRAAIKPFVTALLEAKPSFKNTIGNMLADGKGPFPLPAPRPHHSALV